MTTSLSMFPSLAIEIVMLIQMPFEAEQLLHHCNWHARPRPQKRVWVPSGSICWQGGELLTRAQQTSAPNHTGPITRAEATSRPPIWQSWETSSIPATKKTVDRHACVNESLWLYVNSWTSNDPTHHKKLPGLHIICQSLVRQVQTSILHALSARKAVQDLKSFWEGWCLFLQHTCQTLIVWLLWNVKLSMDLWLHFFLHCKHTLQIGMLLLVVQSSKIKAGQAESKDARLTHENRIGKQWSMKGVSGLPKHSWRAAWNSGRINAARARSSRVPFQGNVCLHWV